MTRLRLRSSDVEWREVEGEIIALVGSTSTYVAANETGTLLWHRLADGATQEELVAELVSRYGVDRASASDDVGRFLESLRANGLLAA